MARSWLFFFLLFCRLKIIDRLIFPEQAILFPGQLLQVGVIGTQPLDLLLQFGITPLKVLVLLSQGARPLLQVPVPEQPAAGGKQKPEKPQGKKEQYNTTKCPPLLAGQPFSGSLRGHDTFFTCTSMPEPAPCHTLLPAQPPRCLVSACLTGLCTRYDGRSKPSPGCRRMLARYQWIPVCPEQLGGLPTPRTPADLVGGDGFAVLAGTARVLDRDGQDRTGQFILGARLVLAIARAQNISLALLKARSPSCGVRSRTGVTAALLLENGIRCLEF